MDSKQVETAIYRARALIIWGKPKEEAIGLLQEAGLSAGKIDEVFRIAMQERGRAIRKKGILYLVIGLGAIIASITLGMFAFSGTEPNGVLMSLDLTVVIFGIHMIFRGVELLIKGSKESGAVSNL
ncbi:hypothetical protein ACFL4W_04090 [Planctomycetota bacterium]